MNNNNNRNWIKRKDVPICWYRILYMYLYLLKSYIKTNHGVYIYMYDVCIRISVSLTFRNGIQIMTKLQSSQCSGHMNHMIEA